MKIALLGSTGMLGSKMAQLCQKAGHSLLVPSHAALDTSDKVQIDGFFKANAFDILINCAAYTKVDACEEKEGANQAYAVNGVGVGFLAAACKEHGRLLIHFSTDYVFDGQKETPYQEGDPTGPINVYGQTKLMGEKEIQEIGPKFYVVRTSWVYGPNGPNFVKTIAGLLKTKPKLPVVTDQVGGPTYTGDLAQFALELIDRKAEPGFYHYANGGYTSWNGFAREIQRLTGANACEITEASSADFVRPAKRPANSRFDLSKGTKAVGHEPRPWQEALKEFLEKELN